jgi:hypothetical protein
MNVQRNFFLLVTLLAVVGPAAGQCSAQRQACDLHHTKYATPACQTGLAS